MNKFLAWADRPNSYIGKALPRPNAKRLLAGRGRYVDDLQLPRMLHAAFFRSSYAHARILSIDVSGAKSMPGVKLVATGEDMAKLCKPWVGTLKHFEGMKSPPQYPLALHKATWVGEPIVAIAAESRALAEDAAERIIVEFEELPPVTDMDAACVFGSERIHQDLTDNIAFHLDLNAGNIDAAFADAHAVLHHRGFSVP